MVQGKEARQEKDEVAVETDPDLTPATETKVLTPITNPDKKGKARAETKKANKDPALVPLAIASRKIHAATAVVQTTPHAPATRDRTTKRMKRIKHLINKPTSTYR